MEERIIDKDELRKVRVTRTDGELDVVDDALPEETPEEGLKELETEYAVEFEGDKTFVNLLTSDSTATDQTFERKEVKLGLSNGVNVEVTEGLSGGEKLRGTKQPAIK